MRRIAYDQIEMALATLDAEAENAMTLHDVRKPCKKSRGLDRLFCPTFGEFKAENTTVRDTMRLFGRQRDAKVLQDIYDELVRVLVGLLVARLLADEPDILADRCATGWKAWRQAGPVRKAALAR